MYVGILTGSPRATSAYQPADQQTGNADQQIGK
jgi:hypothetical protein